ncbi:MAG: pilin [Pseudomonadota bacterium]
MRFYIGHELGHIHRNHIRWGWVLAPVTWLPVLGSAYRRAEEYTCDRYGNACCERESAAVAAMATIVAGDTRWRDIDVAAYLRQVDGTGGFFMSLNELTGDYPWLCKRMAWVLALRQGSEPQFPRRSRRAWVLSLFVPSVPGGFGGAIVLIAIIGIIAAVALPAYQEYVATAELAAQQAAEQLSQSARGAAVEAPASGYWEAATVENLGGIVRETGAMRAAIEEYYAAQSALPTDLTELGWTQSVVPAQNGGIPLAVYQGGVIGAGIDAEQNAYLVIEPAVSDEGTLNWFCYGQNLPAEILPEQCQE